jgi:hypothetical protein
MLSGDWTRPLQAEELPQEQSPHGHYGRALWPLQGRRAQLRRRRCAIESAFVDVRGLFATSQAGEGSSGFESDKKSSMLLSMATLERLEKREPPAE